jgi:hypothetical protein
MGIGGGDKEVGNVFTIFTLRKKSHLNGFKLGEVKKIIVAGRHHLSEMCLFEKHFVLTATELIVLNVRFVKWSTVINVA